MKFLVFAAAVTFTGSIIDRLLLREGVTRYDVLLLSNALTGIFAGFFYLMLKVRGREREHLMEDRLRKIAEMNHHVRNALQVVSFYAHQTKDPKISQLVRESIERIEWALREVLPQGWDLPLNTKETPVPVDDPVHKIER